MFILEAVFIGGLVIVGIISIVYLVLLANGMSR